MTERQKSKHMVTWEMVATMMGITNRHKLSGFLLTLTGGCGMMLFCLMDSAKEGSSTNTIYAVGSVGLISVDSALLIELIVYLKAPREDTEVNDGESNVAERTILVSELADFWVASSIVYTTTHMTLYAMYAIDPHGDWWIYGNFIFPFVFLSYVMGIFSKPLREDRFYKRFLLCHFLQLSVLGEIFGFVGSVRLHSASSAVICALRSLVEIFVFRLTLRVRHIIAQLPREDLSKLLVQQLLVGGASSLATMMFLSFEVVSCLSETSDDGQCGNSANCALWLSGYLVCVSLLSLAKKIVSRQVRNEIALSKERFAAFDLTKKEIAELLCLFVGCACTLILLSALVINGESSAVGSSVGMIGFLALGFALIIEVRSILRTYDAHEIRASANDVELSGDLRGDLVKNLSGVRSSRRFSCSEFAENVTLGGLV